MSIHRHAAKRDSNEPAIIKALELCGASVQQLSGKGVPDLLVGIGGTINALVEVKDPKKGKLTPDQLDWHETWNGAPVKVLTSADQAVEWLENLREKTP